MKATTTRQHRVTIEEEDLVKYLKTQGFDPKGRVRFVFHNGTHDGTKVVTLEWDETLADVISKAN